MRITPLSLAVGLALSACASLADSAPELDLGAPGIGCDGCYVVNAALAGAGSNLFVGGYTDLTKYGLVRRVGRGAWETLASSEPLGGVSQLWATEHELYLAALGGVHRLDLDSHELTPLDMQGKLVWAAGVDRPAVFDRGVAHFFDGDGWVDQPLSIDAPRAVSGSARSNLWVLGQDGAIAHSTGDGFALLDEPPPQAPNDIWAEADTLFAVSGDDHSDHVTGPGAIMRWSAGHWQVLKAAPHDALLGVASAGPDRVYAVGATAEGGAAHPLVWRFDGERWTRRVITTRSVFLWDVFCDSGGACHAAGTDNTFLNLDDLE